MMLTHCVRLWCVLGLAVSQLDIRYKTITPTAYTDLCIDLPGGSAYNGAPLWLWQCSGADAQIWVFDYDAIRYGPDENFCIDALDMSDGLQMVLWECNGLPQQKWGWDWADTLGVYIEDTSVCLDWYDGDYSNGTPLHVWQCNYQANQQWSVWNANIPSGRTTYNVVTDFQVHGDGQTDDTENIQKALQKVMDEGGGIDLYFPAGDYVCGPLSLSGVKSSKSKLIFDYGAQLWMRTDGNWDTNKKDKYVPWFVIDDSDKIEIQGGTWNADYDYWAGFVSSEGHNPRPWIFNFGIDHFFARGITVNDATNAHLRVSGTQIKLRDLNFQAQLPSDNTDGILVCNADHVHVSNVHIQNSDDCLKVCDRAHQVTFEKSSCTGGHGLTIGGGGDYLDINDVTWSDIDLLGMSNGARIKWTTQTSGTIKNVVYEQLRMVNVAIPISIESDYHDLGPRTKSDLAVNSITFDHITEWQDSSQETGSAAKGFKMLGFRCDKKAQCNDLHLRHVNVQSADEWVCEYCGGDLDPKVWPDASGYFSPKSLLGNATAIAV